MNSRSLGAHLGGALLVGAGESLESWRALWLVGISVALGSLKVVAAHERGVRILGGPLRVPGALRPGLVRDAHRRRLRGGGATLGDPLRGTRCGLGGGHRVLALVLCACGRSRV